MNALHIPKQSALVTSLGTVGSVLCVLRAQHFSPAIYFTSTISRQTYFSLQNLYFSPTIFFTDLVYFKVVYFSSAIFLTDGCISREVYFSPVGVFQSGVFFAGSIFHRLVYFKGDVFFFSQRKKEKKTVCPILRIYFI